jgi:UDP-glucose:glycoprotein glucosyltransferase
MIGRFLGVGVFAILLADDVTCYFSESYADIVSVAASVISAIQQPDPSEFSLLDTPPRPRQRPYRKLEAEYT